MPVVGVIRMLSVFVSGVRLEGSCTLHRRHHELEPSPTHRVCQRVGFSFSLYVCAKLGMKYNRETGFKPTVSDKHGQNAGNVCRLI